MKILIKTVLAVISCKDTSCDYERYSSALNLTKPEEPEKKYTDIARNKMAKKSL